MGKTQPLIVYISDIHTGSTHGLMPKEFETIEGQKILPNKFQNWMLDCWNKCWADFDKYRGNRPFWLVINGDLTEGVHHGTKEVWSPDERDHAAAATELLSPVAKKAKATFISLGTECHTKNHEMSIGKELGAVRCPDTGLPAWRTIMLDVNGHLIHVRHHMPATSRVYLEGSALSIMLGNTQLSYARHKQPVPDIVVHSHRHRVGVYQDDESMSVATPAWQGLTRHGHKVVPGSIPKVGLVVMDWVRGSFNLPYTFVIRQPLPPRMESAVKW